MHFTKQLGITILGLVLSTTAIADKIIIYPDASARPGGQVVLNFLPMDVSKKYEVNCDISAKDNSHGEFTYISLEIGKDSGSSPTIDLKPVQYNSRLAIKSSGSHLTVSGVYSDSYFLTIFNHDDHEIKVTNCEAKKM